MPISKSVYGGSSGGIYGWSTCAACPAPSSNIPLLEQFLALLKITTSVVKQFFPGIVTYASFKSNMSAAVGVSPSLYARLYWAQAWPGIRFDKTNMTMLLQLRTIFVESGFDWSQDPVLNKVTWPA